VTDTTNVLQRRGRYRVGVVCDTPSIQLSAQYDVLADLEGFEFQLLLRSSEQANPAWRSRPPIRVGCELLGQLRILPQATRPYLNTGVARVLDRHDFDAVVIHGVYDNLALWQAIHWCARRKRPYLLRCDGNIKKETDAPGARRIRRWLARMNIRRAAALLCIGSQNRKYYESFGAVERQMFLAPWEIDYQDLQAQLERALPKRAELRTALGVDHRVVIASVGRLVASKGFQDVIAGVAPLARGGLPVTLLIGGEGAYRRELEGLAAGAPAGAIRLLGNLTRPAIVELLVSSDVFVLASHSEAWGLVVNEAALAGLPLVVSDAVGAAPDLVIPGANGLVFPAGDTQRLYELLRETVARKELRVSMGEASRTILADWRRRFPAREGYRLALQHALASGAREGSCA